MPEHILYCCSCGHSAFYPINGSRRKRSCTECKGIMKRRAITSEEVEEEFQQEGVSLYYEPFIQSQIEKQRRK